MSTTLLHSDERRRISLGRAIAENTDYRMTTSEDGTVLLEPIVALSRFEVELLSDPIRTQALDAAIASPGISLAEFRQRQAERRSHG